MLSDIPHYPAPTRLELEGMPPPLRGNASREAIRQQNITLRELMELLRGQVERYYAQMKLMEVENGRLRQQAFTKQQGRTKCTEDHKIDMAHGRHMMSDEMMNTLAYIKFKRAWKDVLKEATVKFKLQRKLIDGYYKQIAPDEKEKDRKQKEGERVAKKAANKAEKELK